MILAGILGVYVGIMLFFAAHFYPGTVLNEQNFSFKSRNRAVAQVMKSVDEYELYIKGREGLEDTILGQDIGLELSNSDEINRVLKEQSPFLWIFQIFQKNQYDIPMLVSYSEELLKERIDTLVFFRPENIKQPEKAKIGEFNGDGYELVPEKPGTVLEPEDTFRVLTEAVNSLEAVLDLDKAGCYLQPGSNMEQLNKNLDLLNRYAGAVITYQFGEETEVVDKTLIHEWLKTDSDTVAFDEEKVREFVNGLSKRHDSFGKTRTFMTSHGYTVSLPSGGYGWWMNRAEETKELIETVKTGAHTDRTPVYLSTAYQYGEDDIGNTYIEIDLGAQHLYAYQNGMLLLETDFVSGNAARGWSTPIGVFGITYKERNATLKGENYRTPVNFWMPFNGNVGMHDATWRKEFGGTIYMTNGSHGCVNLPYQMASKIYEMVEKGMPVIVYQGATPSAAEGTVSGNEAAPAEAPAETGVLDAGIQEYVVPELPAAEVPPAV